MNRIIAITIATAAATAVSLGAFAVGSAQTSETTFHACEQNGKVIGKIFVDSAPACGGNSSPVSWSSSSPPPTAGDGPTTQVIPGLSSFGRSTCNDVWAFIEDNCGDDIDIARAFAFPIDGGDYPASTTFTVEANLFNYGDVSTDACYRLVDLDTLAVVPNSESCVLVGPANVVADFQNGIEGQPSVAEFRSDSFVLPAGDHSYGIESRVVGFDSGFGPEGPYGASAVRIRADWD